MYYYNECILSMQTIRERCLTGCQETEGGILDFVDSARKAKKGECWLRRCEDCNEGVDVRIQARC